MPGDNSPLDTQALAINDNGPVIGVACCGLDGAHEYSLFSYDGSLGEQCYAWGCIISAFTNSVDEGSVFGFPYPDQSAPVAPTAFTDGQVIVGNILSSFYSEYDGAVLNGIYGNPSSLLTYPGVTVGYGDTFLSGINDSGEIVGSYYNYMTDTGGGFTYQNGLFTNLSFTPLAINNNGQIVGQIANGDIVVDTNGVLKDLGSFPFAPSSVNDSLQTVGGDYLYEGGNFIQVQVPGASSTSVNGINDSGVMVGAYGTPAGTFGFVATPEPAYFLVLVVGIGPLYGMHTRRALLRRA